MNRGTMTAALGGLIYGFLAALGFGPERAAGQAATDTGSSGGMMGQGMSHMDMRIMMSRDNMMRPMKLAWRCSSVTRKSPGQQSTCRMASSTPPFRAIRQPPN